ncbi:hypothetical protein [Saccharibacillus endophyticus]|uniref:hypothetical protein n=1 Tax=Saccharibacillus endophyticus TaxID=2060666 RepID=UPI0015528C91|nr:hypothetical protein [Saccharibacillus endophyticus]
MTDITGAISIQTSKSSSNFIWDRQWFMYQRILISEIYPDFPNDDVLRIYLFLCKHIDQKSGKAKVTKSSINKRLHYTKQTNPNAHRYLLAVNQSLKWLEDKGFIRQTNLRKRTWYECKILKAPDFRSIQDYRQPSFAISNWYTLKNENRGYSMIPKSLFSDRKLSSTSANRKIWTNGVLKTLLILYAHNWLEYYGGIDPKILEVDTRGRAVPSDWLCCNLKATKKDVKTWIRFLRKKKLLQSVECYFENNIYYGDVLCCPPPSKYDIKKIFRPTYLIAHQLDSDSMKNKKARML